MESTITLQGKIHFEPENKTKKHNSQSSWKRMAMVMFSGDVTDYYSWFILKRYNLELNKPLRGAHVSFINDSIKELSCNGTKTMEQINTDWEAVKKKWDGKTIDVTFDLDACTDDKWWWLRVSHDKRDVLQGIRNELGLGKPFWGLHMTIGTAEHLRFEHSKYIHRLIKKGLIK